MSIQIISPFLNWIIWDFFFFDPVWFCENSSHAVMVLCSKASSGVPAHSDQSHPHWWLLIISPFLQWLPLPPPSVSQDFFLHTCQPWSLSRASAHSVPSTWNDFLTDIACGLFPHLVCVLLGIEPRALHLLHSTTWTTSSALLFLFCSWDSLCPGWPWTWNPPASTF
jgi:hypothetical protein